MDELVQLEEQGQLNEITPGHRGSLALAMFNNQVISDGGLRLWILNGSKDRDIDLLVELTDYALEKGIKDIQVVNKLFHKIKSLPNVFSPEVLEITEEYRSLDKTKLVSAYADSVLLYID